MRGKEDKWNSFTGGFMVNSFLKLKSTSHPRKVVMAGIFGGSFILVFDSLGVM